MKCPYCNKDMELGSISNYREPIVWDPSENSKIKKRIKLLGYFLSENSSLDVYYCPFCEKMIFDVIKIEKPVIYTDEVSSFPTLEAANLKLRNIVAKDEAVFIDLYNNSKSLISLSFKNLTRYDIFDSLSKTDSLSWGVDNFFPNKTIGVMSLLKINKDEGIAEIGYIFNNHYIKYIPEVLKAISYYAFKEMKLSYLNAFIPEEDLKLCEKFEKAHFHKINKEEKIIFYQIKNNL